MNKLKIVEKQEYSSLEEKALRLKDLMNEVKPLEAEINALKDDLKKSGEERIGDITISTSEIVKITANTDQIMDILGNDFDLCFKLEAKLEDSKILKKLAEVKPEIKKIFSIVEQKRVLVK